MYPRPLLCSLVYVLSKPSLLGLLITSLSAVFPFPAASYLPLSPLPFISGPASSDQRRRGGKTERQRRGMRAERSGEEEKSGPSYCGRRTHSCAHRGPLFGGPAAGPCDHTDPEWSTCGPLFLPRSSFHLLPACLLILKGLLFLLVFRSAFAPSSRDLCASRNKTSISGLNLKPHIYSWGGSKGLMWRNSFVQTRLETSRLGIVWKPSTLKSLWSFFNKYPSNKNNPNYLYT